MEGIQATLISYDVMCQWSIHMMERVNGSKYLKLPDNLELKLAIRLFHIHGHRTPAGSIPSIEGGANRWQDHRNTLGTVNKITRSTRGMSTSHRQEVIDDHMNDSNWKKLTDIGKFPHKDTGSMLTWFSSKFHVWMLPKGTFGGHSECRSLRFHKFICTSRICPSMECQRGVCTKGERSWHQNYGYLWHQNEIMWV